MMGGSSGRQPPCYARLQWLPAAESGCKPSQPISPIDPASDCKRLVLRSILQALLFSVVPIVPSRFYRRSASSKTRLCPLCPETSAIRS